MSDSPDDWLKRPLDPWGPPESATPEGIVGVGGDLRPATLVRAYGTGIFPWFNDGDPIIWWSPDPRAVIGLTDFHVPKRLAATLRQNKFRVTVNERFAEVVRACGECRPEGTWITDEMLEAYIDLHEVGHAHSLETWLGDELVGGIYGVSVGGFFAGESMFHRATDASKVALVKMLERLRERGYTLFDVQIINDHTRQFGAHEIARGDYLTRLRAAVAKAGVTFA